jgi:hypothetical protein
MPTDDEIKALNEVLFVQLEGPPAGWWGIRFIRWFRRCYGYKPELDQETKQLCEAYTAGFLHGFKLMGGDPRTARKLCRNQSHAQLREIAAINDFTRRRMRDDGGLFGPDGEQRIRPPVTELELPDEPPPPM